jgi:uncharacterized protein YciI
MYIANLTYIKSLEEVEVYLEEHIAYLDKYYQLGKFICSGRKNPRDGGIILFNADNEIEMKKIMAEDPFSQHQVASYEIIEFFPTKYAGDFKCFTKSQ